MRVLDEIGIGSRDQHLPGHTEMHYPLAGWRKVYYDVFANALHLVDARTLEYLRDLLRRGFQRLGLGADPHGFDHVAGNALIEAAGDGFDFGEFGHFGSSSLNNWKI